MDVVNGPMKYQVAAVFIFWRKKRFSGKLQKIKMKCGPQQMPISQCMCNYL